MEWILIVVGLAAVLAIVWYVLRGRTEAEAHTDARGVVAPHPETTTQPERAVEAPEPAVVPVVTETAVDAPAHAGSHVVASPAAQAPAAEVVRDQDAYDDVVVREADDADDLIDVPDADDPATRVDAAAAQPAGTRVVDADATPASDHAARIDEAAAQLDGASAQPGAGRRFEDAPAAEPERVAEPEQPVESVVVPDAAQTPAAEPIIEPEPPVAQPEPAPARRLVEPAEPDVEQVWDGPFGPGSAEAGPNGEGPRGWTIKGARQTKVYLTPDIPVFNSAKANVWFVDEQRAIDAGFRRWDAPQA